jgi:hypothetical protein
VVLPGSHQIVASKTGRVPDTREVVISPGERIEVQMRLRMPERVATERYAPAWAPWAGMGVGVALISTGAYFDWRSSADLAAYKEDFNAHCPRGCTDVETPELTDHWRDTEAGKHTALGFYVVGGALVMGSAVMLYVNRERVVRAEARPDTLSMAPVWSPHAAGLVLTGEF